MTRKVAGEMCEGVVRVVTVLWDCKRGGRTMRIPRDCRVVKYLKCCKENVIDVSSGICRNLRNRFYYHRRKGV